MSHKNLNDVRPGYARLLDAWVAPEAAGDPIGVITTTFTFNAAFFEEACLSRFLNLMSDPDEDGPVYLIEREEKLAGIRGATVLVDAHHCRGSRSLRWDLLPVLMDNGGILHAKVSLLHWAHLVRVIVGSANMTEEAYRRNREIFGVLDFLPGTEAPVPAGIAVMDLLQSLLEQTIHQKGKSAPAQERALAVLAQARNFVQSIDVDTSRTHRKRSLHLAPVFTGPNRDDAFSQVTTLWPGGLPPYRAYVTSPFFDEANKRNRPAEALWQILRQRGEAEVTYNVLADEIEGDAGIFVHAPQSLIDATPAQRRSVSTYFVRLPQEDSSPEGNRHYRPLHLKSLWLENEGWAAYLIGSSNFTSAGLGLSKSSNIEANLLYMAPLEEKFPFYRQLMSAYLEGEDIDLQQPLRWQPLPDEELEEMALIECLPSGFGQALYDRDESGQGYLHLEITGKLPADWTLYKPQTGIVILEEAAWHQKGKPAKIRLPWSEAAPPSGLEISWPDAVARAWWPVNALSATALPPPRSLEDLPLELLIQILTSSRPLHEVLRQWLRRKSQRTHTGNDAELLDPHQRVDVSTFLLHRTRRFSWALSALKARLERPVGTPEVLHWRLWGPVGVKAVSHDITKEARTTDERVFLISELILELANLKPQSAPGCLTSQEIETAIKEVLSTLRNEIQEDAQALAGNLQQYVNGILSGVRQ